MLSTMRKGVSTIFAKALMILLVLSFALWGVGDMIRQGGTQSVAKVGDSRISPQEFNERMARAKAQMQGMPEEMLNSSMMRTQVLQGMVQQLLLLQESNRIGLKINDDIIAQVIRENPQFQDKNGSFSEIRFLSFLQNNRVSEAGFIATIRNDVESASVLQTLDMPESLQFQTLNNVLALAKRQSRSADIFIIPQTKIEKKEPSDKALNALYETIKADYMVPETRSISYIVADVTAINAAISKNISEEAIADRYAAEKDALGKPETRDVMQYLFADKKSAKAAAAALAGGSTDSVIAKDFGLKNGKPVVMNAITADALPDAVSAIVFDAPEKGFTPPVKTDFGWNVYKITSVTKRTVPSLESSKETIRTLLFNEEKESALHDISYKIEDALAAGDTIEAAVKSLGYDAKTFTITADKSKRTQGEAKSLEAYVINTGFALAESEFSGFQEYGKAYVAVTVGSITPETAKPLNDVRTQVLSRFHESELTRISAEHAAATAAALRTSKDPVAVASKSGVSVRSLGPVRLAEALASTKDVGGIPSELRRRLFETDLGDMTTPVQMPNGSWALAKVTKITQDTDFADTASPISRELTPALNNTVYANYLRHLTTLYPVDVNEELLNGSAENP